MEILHEFTNWITKNYSHTKGGYRHRGDFYRNDKPVNLQALKDRFINEKQSEGNLVKLKQADVSGSFSHEIIEKIRNSPSDAEARRIIMSIKNCH